MTERPADVEDYTEQPEEVTTKKKRSPAVNPGRTIISKRRDKRFVVPLLAAAGAALGITGLAGSFSALFHSGASESELKSLASDLSKVMDVEEEQIGRLNATLGAVLQGLEETDKEGHFLLGFLAMIVQSGVFFERIRDLRLGLTALLHKELSPSLVRADELRRMFSEVKEKMARYDAVPLVSTPLALYSLDVGHTFDSDNLEVNVRLIIPGKQKGADMILYRYLPFPVLMSEADNRYGLPNIHDHYLGVRIDQQNTDKLYHVLTSTEFSECQRVEGVLACNVPTAYHRSSKAVCLEAVFTQASAEGEGLTRHCAFSPIEQENYLLQSTTGLFHLFLPETESITVVCGKHPTTYAPMQGLIKVYLPAGCRGVTKRLDFRPEIGVRRSNTTITRAQFKINDLVGSEHVDSWSQLAKERRMPAHGLTFDEAKARVKADTDALETHSILFYISMAALGIGSCFLLVFVGTRFCRCKICVRRENEERRRNREREPVYETMRMRKVEELGDDEDSKTVVQDS